MSEADSASCDEAVSLALKEQSRQVEPQPSTAADALDTMHTSDTAIVRSNGTDKLESDDAFEEVENEIEDDLEEAGLDDDDDDGEEEEEEEDGEDNEDEDIDVDVDVDVDADEEEDDDSNNNNAGEEVQSEDDPLHEPSSNVPLSDSPFGQLLQVARNPDAYQLHATDKAKLKLSVKQNPSARNQGTKKRDAIFSPTDAGLSESSDDASGSFSGAAIRGDSAFKFAAYSSGLVGSNGGKSGPTNGALGSGVCIANGSASGGAGVGSGVYQEHGQMISEREQILKRIRELESDLGLEDPSKRSVALVSLPDIGEDEEVELFEAPPHCIPIRADVRAFDWKSLSESVQFDVILMDPPWQLAGAQPTRGVAIAYSQLPNQDIENMPIPSLQKDGFIFIWVINSRYSYAVNLMRKWGYHMVDDIVWVKKTVNRKLAKGHGFYLQHAKENCLVGKKGKDPVNLNPSVAMDYIFSERRGQSQKPEELYEIIEKMIPNGRYLEIFARKNNLRDHWVSVGNEL